MTTIHASERIYTLVEKDRGLLVNYRLYLKMRSGLSVQGPSRGGPRGPNDIVGDIMKKAAESNEEAAEELAKSNNETANVFSGRGNRLGSEEDPAENTQGGSFETDDDWEEVDDEEPVNRSLTFWRDGFSIDDGPLMRYDEVCRVLCSEISNVDLYSIKKHWMHLILVEHHSHS